MHICGVRKMKRLLSVDDDAQILAIIRTVAIELGFEIEALLDSSRFMTAYVRMKPDIITLDIVMPDIDGIELIRWLSDVGCGASVILLSGGSPLYVRAGQRLAEAKGSLRMSILSKPFSLADLRSALTAAGPTTRYAASSLGDQPCGFDRFVG